MESLVALVCLVGDISATEILYLESLRGADK